MLQRPGLLFLRSNPTPVSPTVYVAFSMMDGTKPNPSGWVLAYDGGNLLQGGYPLVFDTTPNVQVGSAAGGGVWQGGAGLAAGLDANGNNFIYFSTADGAYDSNNDYGDSFLKLNTELQLPTNPNFTPADWFYRWDHSCNNMHGWDLDIGSSGEMLVPDGILTDSHYQNIAIKGDKESYIWVIDRTNPGGTGTGCSKY
jgi:hypothetical protein